MEWKTLEKKPLLKKGFLSIDSERCELPDGRIMEDYYVMNLPHWVNIFAITPEGKVVMVEQYRQAAQGIYLELPGGGVHQGEDPSVAAQRELLEETGYSCENLVKVFEHEPNPAMQRNTMYTYLATNALKTSEQSLDPYEDLVVKEVAIEDLRKKLQSGALSHTIVVASLYKCLDAYGAL